MCYRVSCYAFIHGETPTHFMFSRIKPNNQKFAYCIDCRYFMCLLNNGKYFSPSIVEKELTTHRKIFLAIRIFASKFSTFFNNKNSSLNASNFQMHCKNSV